MDNVLYLAPVITGVVEAAKRAGLPAKFCPLLAIVVGIGFSFLVPSANWTENLIRGLATGLASVGLYEAVAQPALEALKLK